MILSPIFEPGKQGLNLPNSMKDGYFDHVPFFSHLLTDLAHLWPSHRYVCFVFQTHYCFSWQKKLFVRAEVSYKFHFYFRESTIALQQLAQFWNNNLLLDVRLRKLLTLVDSDLFMDKQILLTGGIWEITAYSQFVIFEAWNTIDLKM